MEISSSQMFRKLNSWCLNAVIVFSIAGTFTTIAQDGGALFSAKCGTCHQPHKDGTGPKLVGVREAWAAGGAGETAIYEWVRNWEKAAAADPYAASIVNKKPTAMNKFPDLTDDQITAILDWVDAQPEPGAAVAGVGSGGAENLTTENEGGLGWIWIILGVIFIGIIMAVGGVRRQLQIATGEKEDAGQSYGDEFKSWAWKYKRYVGVAGLVIVLAVIVTLFQGLYKINVMEGYHPSQPIEFPHSVHAGINKIDCKYCHNSASKSKSAGIPTVNVCMNCHKQINGNTPEQQKEIAKIYEAAGWDGEKYTGKTKEIVWNKVHNLPDHVYFNHAQHVEVGGVDCKQCHGDMTKRKETPQVMAVSDLNKVEGNVKLTKPTLTMGWCIECHGEKEVSMGPLDTKKDGYYNEIHQRLLNNDKSLYGKYLDDGKVSVKELGGWECSKCHY